MVNEKEIVRVLELPKRPPHDKPVEERRREWGPLE